MKLNRRIKNRVAQGRRSLGARILADLKTSATRLYSQGNDAHARHVRYDALKNLPSPNVIAGKVADVIPKPQE